MPTPQNREDFLAEAVPLFSALYEIAAKYNVPMICTSAPIEDEEHYSQAGSIYVPAEAPDRLKLIAALCVGEAEIGMSFGNSVLVNITEQPTNNKELN